MILKIFSPKNVPKNVPKKLAFFAQSTASFCKNFITKFVFEKKCQFFRRKWAKIAQNSDHNIDPSLENWSQSYDFGIYNYNASVVEG
jgi:hypothetical protein